MNLENESTRSEKQARRLLMMKRVLEVLGWLTAVALFAFAGHAVLAAAPAHAAARTQRTGSQDDSGAGRGRARQTRPREDLSPGSLVREARTLFVAESR